jgi:hypothetical protein
MSGIRLLRVGCAVLCITIVMAAGTIAAVAAHWLPAVRAMVMVITAVCLLAGSALVATGATKIIIRMGEIQRLAAAQDRDRAGQDAQRA